MLFSVIGEIGLIVIGSLYVLDCWFDSFINMMTILKDSEDEQKQKEIPESAKHMYS